MAKGRKLADRAMSKSALGALDAIEPELRHLNGLISALSILGEATDSIEPVAIFSLARCAHQTLGGIARDWRLAIDALRAHSS